MYVMKLLLILLLLSAGHACTVQTDLRVVDDIPSIEIFHPEPGFSYPEIDDDTLSRAVADIAGITSFLLFHNDEIVMERYAGGGSRNGYTNIKSVSKSVLNVLVYAALEHGFIESLDQPIDTWLGDYFRAIDDERKRRITVRHLLTMSTGLESTSFDNYGRWVVSADWIAFALNAELQHEPGSRMVYSTGDTHLLSAVLTRATGMSLREFASRYFSGPAGIGIGGWDRDPRGFYFGGNNMALTPGGLLSLGRLYLDKGSLNGRRILSEAWVEESLTTHFVRTSFNPRGHDYGYLWWHNTFGPYSTWFAWGHGGQYVFILPDFNAVAVFTGNPDRRVGGLNDHIFTLMERQVVPWLIGNDRPR
jgi:CubicO group peptidase (beta-lactamase class C family)